MSRKGFDSGVETLAPAGALLAGRWGGRRPLPALLCIAVAVWSVAGYLGDRGARRGAEQVAARFQLDRRQPVEMSASRAEPAADGAMAVVAEAILEGAVGAAAPAAAPRLPEKAAPEKALELEAAGGLVLDSLERRPGWPQHRLLLGKIAYADQRLEPGGSRKPESWIVPLRLAATGAPGLEPAWTVLGGAYLEAWPTLEPAARAEVPGVLTEAFLDPAFVSRSFPSAASHLGGEAAAKLLPEEPSPLLAAADSLAAAGDVSGAAALLPRIGRSARADRDKRLRWLAELRRYGDLEGARSACLAWVRDYSAYDFDDSAGRAQTARLLALWPADVVGSWRSDPRGELVRFFLNHRERDVPGAVLARATAILLDVPDTVRAQIRLLSGQETEALELARSSAGSGSFEWSGFYLQLARVRLERGDASGAKVALAGIPPSAREGCDALLCYRDVAVSLGDEEGTKIASELLRFLERDSYPPEAWSADGTLSLCLLPERIANLRLLVDVQAEGEATARYGWNGGSMGTSRISPGTSSLAVPLPPASGRQTLSVRTGWGSPIRPGQAVLSPGGVASQ